MVWGRYRLATRERVTRSRQNMTHPPPLRDPRSNDDQACDLMCKVCACGMCVFTAICLGMYTIALSGGYMQAAAGSVDVSTNESHT